MESPRLFTHPQALKMGYFYWLRVKNSNHLHTELSLGYLEDLEALAGDIVLCSWARHFTLTMSLSAQLYNWVPANCWGKPNKLRGSPAMD